MFFERKQAHLIMIDRNGICNKYSILQLQLWWYNSYFYWSVNVILRFIA